MAKRYKIHPAIGVARLGNSTVSFLGPTSPGVLPDPGDGGSYRDPATGGLKCQAVKFWVFEYDDGQSADDAKPVSIGNGIVGIEWTVHVANKKAFWFNFDGLTGSKDIRNPPNYGYAATPASWRNSHIVNSANRRKELIIDPGPRTLNAVSTSAEFKQGTAGGYPEQWPGPLVNAEGTVKIDSLGKMRVDADWTMTFTPAPGVSGSTDGSGLIDFANNPNWFDNTSDGPVRANLILSNGTRIPADPAWLLVSPPDFAPAIENIVSLYDVLFDVSVRHFGSRPDIFTGPSPTAVDDFNSKSPPFNNAFIPSFIDDVYPILFRAMQYAWVHQAGSNFHTKWDLNALSAKPFVVGTNPFSPAQIFTFLRQPENWHTLPAKKLMPILFGDSDSTSRLTLTPTQYHIMRQWSAGTFNRTGWVWPVPAPTSPAVPTAKGLDRAALMACSGGAFFPGIEMGWISREWNLYVSPFEFRFAHPLPGGDPLGIDLTTATFGLYPGDVTKRMACPWQSDFWKCSDTWWPAQRPDEVVVNAGTLARDAWDRKTQLVGGTAVSGHMGMVVNWHRLGVVAPAVGASGTVVQAERDRVLP